MTNLRGGLAIAAVIVLAGCGSSSTAHVNGSPSPAATASAAGSPGATPSSAAGSFPSPSPGATSSVAPLSFSCSSTPTPGMHLGLVKLRGVAGVIVRDITDITHPVSRCTFAGTGANFRFYDAAHVSYVVTASSDLGAPGALYLANLVTRTTSLVLAWSYGGFASGIYAWSPDGQELTYLSSDTSGLKWHLLSGGGDRVLSTLGKIQARGVSPDNDDAMVGFSADGQYVAVEETFTGGGAGTAPPVQVNRVSDGSLAYSRTDGTMAAWAGTGARLYFRTAAGVQAWGPTGGVATISAGTNWIHPMPSPDGSRMAFSVLNAQQNHIGEVIDLTSPSGTIRQLSALPRVGASFLNASLVWYAGESICTTATPCGLGGPPLSGQTYIYDLGSDVETGSVDTAFYDSWPHVVGQS